MNKNNSNVTKAAIAVVVSVVMIAVLSMILPKGTSSLPAADTSAEQTVTETEKNEAVTEAEPEEYLSHWTADAQAKQALMAFVEEAVNENSSGYIPVENRIAVFDLDGTLYCETDPVYFDYQLLRHRVLEDETYKDQASDFEKEVAEKINVMIETGKSADGLPVDHGKAVASAFAGMTLNEFHQYVLDFGNEPAPGYENMKRREAFYVPMKEVIEYLQANDFTTYIVSGTDRLIVRGIVEGNLNIPTTQIIGSDEQIVAKNQDETDGLDYSYAPGDNLILGGEFIIKNLKMNKVAVIAQEIGIQPVLSFGNSSGDSSMAEYTILNNPYNSLAFMLCCDDLERENGNESSAEKMAKMCEENDWIAISMKNDWTTIYPEGVTRK